MFKSSDSRTSDGIKFHCLAQLYLNDLLPHSKLKWGSSILDAFPLRLYLVCFILKLLLMYQGPWPFKHLKSKIIDWKSLRWCKVWIPALFRRVSYVVDFGTPRRVLNRYSLLSSILPCSTFPMPRRSGLQYSRWGKMYALYRRIMTSCRTNLRSLRRAAAFAQAFRNWSLMWPEC